MPLISLPAILPWLPPCKINLIPVEILTEIFLLTEIYWAMDYTDLMLVCWRWHDIILSIPGFTSRLHIRRSTKVEAVQAFIQGRRSRLEVIVDVNDETHGKDFNPDDFHASFMAAIQAASRWHSLSLHSFPLPGECKPFQIVQTLELASFRLDQGCDLGSFFGPLMTSITTIALPRLTDLRLCDLSAVLYLVQPAQIRFFCHLRTLVISLNKRMESPVDILPSLQRLETFEARHLHLPIYPPDASLPLIQTLCDLRLKSVSVQWMAGKVFPALRTCSITFPHHIGTIMLQPVTMPVCTSLEYDSIDLDPLIYFHHHPLEKLSMTSGQWNVSRGNSQLVAMGPKIVASAQSLTKLHLYVQCSGQLLAYVLRVVLALVGLTLGLASPHALSRALFQAFVAMESHEWMDAPFCAGLQALTLQYRRWLSDPERDELIQVFSEIVISREWHLWEPLLLELRFDVPDQSWHFGRPDEDYLEEGLSEEESIIGILGPFGIIPLEFWGDSPLMEVPFKETEYLWARHQLSIGCLSSLRHLVEVRVEIEQDLLPRAPPPNLPLFRTLRVLDTKRIHPSFLAGQTFHKLERCRVSLWVESPELGQGQITQMPVCTRLDVGDITLLATFKLPRIRELGVSLDHPEFNMIWAKHIVVNSNLSGLELLHMRGWHQQVDLVQVFRCLPVLKTLILGSGPVLSADFFGEFVPMDLNETSAPVQSRDMGRASAILCPMLTSLRVERLDPTERLEIIPVLEEVVTLRAVGGSPLKEFALYSFKEGHRIWQLIGRNGSFVVDGPSRFSRPFELNFRYERGWASL